MEEQNEVSWFVEKRNKFIEFFKSRPELTLTVIGGLFTVLGACINYCTVKNEYKDQVYMTDGEDVYRIPAKAMNSKKLKTVN